MEWKNSGKREAIRSVKQKEFSWIRSFNVSTSIKCLPEDILRYCLRCHLRTNLVFGVCVCVCIFSCCTVHGVKPMMEWDWKRFAIVLYLLEYVNQFFFATEKDIQSFSSPFFLLPFHFAYIECLVATSVWAFLFFFGSVPVPSQYFDFMKYFYYFWSSVKLHLTNTIYVCIVVHA